MIGGENTFMDFSIVAVFYFIWCIFCTCRLFRWFRWICYLISILGVIGLYNAGYSGIKDLILFMIILWHPAYIISIIKGLVYLVKEKF